MTKSKKLLVAFFVFAMFAASLIAGVMNLATARTLAATEEVSFKYYYENLNETDSRGNSSEYKLARKFYNALESINESGAFKKGVVDYSLDSILTSDQIKGWVIDGQLEIPKAFGAARDSFLVDHPELFYVDMYKLTISAGRTNGVYSAYIDCGKEANCYRDPKVNTEALVEEEIVKFDTAVNQIKDLAISEAAKQPKGVENDYALAIAANEVLASRVEYDFDEYNNYIDNEGDVSATPMTYSAYGALVNKKAVCSGFAQAYKVVLDRLDIPCIVVSGFCKGQTKDGEDTDFDVGHAWNYVYLKTGTKDSSQGISAQADTDNGAWFAFDTTWNSLNKDINRYSAMNAVVFSQKHIADGVISSSNYRLTYPALSIMNYQQALDPSQFDFSVKEEGFVYQAKYHDNTLTEILSYNGKSLNQVEEGNRVIFRWYYKDIQGDGKEKWTKWTDFERYSEFVNSQAEAIVHESNRTIISAMGMSNTRFTQYAIVKDLIGDEDYVISKFTYEGFYYSDNEVVENHSVFMSQLYQNTAYGSYTPAPYLSISKTKPFFGADILIDDYMREGNSNLMADRYAITISLVYNEPLHVLDRSKPIVVNYTPTSYNTTKYASFAKFADGEYVHLVADKNGVKNTLQFRFKPSLMYEHNRESYTFTFENVGSAKVVDKLINGKLVETTSDKAPNYAYYTFGRIPMVCPRVFGDGRLWVECCAQPTLVDNSDLAAMDFKDEEGNSTFTENARSQMMLVVNNVSDQTENTMLDEISESDLLNVDKSEIKASQTYDIALQICGKYPTIPDGSYVKIALGFPEGYGPEDEGVTFKLYHRKHNVANDTYEIEEVPCVVTKFGIVATVTSFSPYMVAVVPEEKATAKTVYASIDGKGGRLTNEDGKIQTLTEGQTYTYTIAPDDGYKLYKVMLNGEDVTSKIENDKLTVRYEELLLNNELEIQYISNVASQRYEEKNIVDPVKIYVTADDFKAPVAQDEPTNKAVPVLGIVLGVIAAVGVAAAVAVIIKRKSIKQK